MIGLFDGLRVTPDHASRAVDVLADPGRYSQGVKGLEQSHLLLGMLSAEVCASHAQAAEAVVLITTNPDLLPLRQTTGDLAVGIAAGERLGYLIGMEIANG